MTTRREKIEQRLLEQPDDLFLNYSYAMELAKCGDIELTRQAFERVRQLDPNYVAAYFQEAQFLATQGEEDAARQLLQAGIAVARNVGDSHALAEMTEYLEAL